MKSKWIPPTQKQKTAEEEQTQERSHSVYAFLNGKKQGNQMQQQYFIVISWLNLIR